MGKMIKLTRDMILNVSDVKEETVEVPEWGGMVTVKAMTGRERDYFESSLIDPDGGKKPNMVNVRAKLVALSVIDPDTKELMFSTGDIEILGQKSAGALDRIFTVSQRLSKITEKDIEELAKN